VKIVRLSATSHNEDQERHAENALRREHNLVSVFVSPISPPDKARMVFGPPQKNPPGERTIVCQMDHSIRHIFDAR
jgi:hypothetical protein